MEKERKRYIMTIQEKKQVLAQYQTTKTEIIRLTKERDDWNDLAYQFPPTILTRWFPVGARWTKSKLY